MLSTARLERPKRLCEGARTLSEAAHRLYERAVATRAWYGSLVPIHGASDGDAELQEVQPRVKTILVVDDHPAARYVIARTLSNAGFDVRETATGRDALQLARLKPDAIVLDIALPDIDGFEVVHLLRSDPFTMLIPVLHKSGYYCDAEHRQRGIAAGADDYLTEPFTPHELVDAVRRLLGSADRGRGPASPA